MFLLEGHTGAVRALAYGPDSTRLVSAGEDGTLLLWHLGGPHNATKMVESSSPTGGPISIESICWGSDSTIFLSYLMDSSGSLRRIPPRADGRSSKSIQTPELRCIREFQRKQSRSLFTVPWNGPVSERDYESLKSLETELQMMGSVRSIATSGDRTIALLATHNGWVRRIGPNGWQQSQFETDGSPIHQIACDPLVNHFVLANQVGTLLLYRTGGWIPELVLRMSHPGVVLGLAFTPDGRRLVSGGADGTVRIWDVHSGEQLHVFEWHRKWVTCLAMSPDGTTVATGSEDSTIAVWDMPD